MNDIAKHYDLLIDENNDPVHDPEPLRKYMDKWDGQGFIESLELNKSKSILEIGVGTGRLAIKIAPLCSEFTGIDLSEKTIIKAKENLADFENTNLICDNYLSVNLGKTFDVIYSSLTFMHIKEKQIAINKVFDLLNNNGIFALSIDKNQSNTIDAGISKISIYPDNPAEIESYIKSSGLTIIKQYETEFAYIFIAKKKLK
ncbi:MAG: class I SAM-dependent methyltransferase [Eubacterium sp.]|nr:class I SAM-dependent methyltransferase [Eubacterium sp.]